MRLSYKLSFGTVVALTLATSISAYVEVERETAEYERDLVLDNMREARALAVTVTKLWLSFGDAGAIEVLNAANDVTRNVRAEWIGLRRLLGGNLLHLSADELDALRVGQPVGRLVNLAESRAAAVAFAPVVVDRTVRGAVQLSRIAVDRQEFVARHVQQAALTALSIVVVSWLVAVFLGRRWVGGPIDRLVQKAHRVGSGTLDEPLYLDTKDELATLADAMNAMSASILSSREQLKKETQARLDAMEQVRHADRLATIGQLAAGIAHELGTPLNIVSERAKMARDGEVSAADLPRTYDIIIEQSGRIAATVRQLLDFARQQQPTKSRADLRDLAEATRDLLATAAAKKGIAVRVEGETSAPAYVDAMQIRQVLTNLVMNGLFAMDAPGELTLTIARARMPAAAGQPAGDGEECWALAVRDQGRGIEKEHLPRVFEPFFTTKRAGEGTGLGLSIVQGIVEEHGGVVKVASTPTEGSTFTVYLPLEAAT